MTEEQVKTIALVADGLDRIGLKLVMQDVMSAETVQAAADRGLVTMGDVVSEWLTHDTLDPEYVKLVVTTLEHTRETIESIEDMLTRLAGQS